MKNKTMKDKVRSVAQVVIHRGVNATMTGRKTFNLSFHLEQNDFIALLEFMVAHGYELQEAISTIEQLKKQQMENVRSTVARSGKSYDHDAGGAGFLYGVFIFLVLIFTALAAAEVLPMWGLGLAGAFSLGMIWLTWSPQNAALNAVWRKNDPPQQKLEQMLELLDEAPLAYAFHQKTAVFIALAVATVLFVAGPFTISAVQAVGAANYHQAIIAGGAPLQMTQSTGDKFVLYDMEKGRYFADDYLPKKYQASTTEEVGGVLKIDVDEKKVGSYGSVGDAYKYYITVSLYDCATGEIIGSKKLAGGEPPKTVRVKTTSMLFGKRKFHGSKPSDDELERACLSLIRMYQDAH